MRPLLSSPHFIRPHHRLSPSQSICLHPQKTLLLHIRQYHNTPSPTSPRKILITGASRGIGLAIAHRFASQQHTLILVGRDNRTLEAVREDILQSQRQRETEGPGGEILEGAGGKDGSGEVEIKCRVGDVKDRGFWEAVRRDEIRHTAEFLFRHMQPQIDILVNAAGLAHSSLFMKTTPALIEDVVQTNLMGTMWACREMVKGMVRRRRGCIINISSLLGVKGGTGSVAYAASKAGILGLTRSLAAEVGPFNVRVNAIVPGYIETQMTREMTLEARQRALDAVPAGRFGTAAEVADAAVFLASNEYANNCVLNLDGGLSAV